MLSIDYFFCQDVLCHEIYHAVYAAESLAQQMPNGEE
jgi:hypothetical protein